MDPIQNDGLFIETFFKPNFEIDEYLSQCTQKSDLLTLRKDLKNYGMELYTVMVDILKTETEGIINLAENLTGLNVKLDELYSPVSQLCEEIRSLYYTINSAKVDFKQHLDKIESIMNEKDHLNLKIGIFSTSSYINNTILSWSKEEDITILERAVNEYSFQFLYLRELGFESVILENNIQDTAARLLELIDTVFFKSLKERNETKLLRCLRMYLNLVQQPTAEECLRKQVVAPVLSVIFTQRNLDHHNQDVKSLYKQAIQFLNEEICPLLMILERNADMRGFNFVINSFWVEVDKQLRENLPNITAPGNPELFQKRFQDTWNFLEEIAKVSGDLNIFKQNKSFEAHMKRFNLPVYFEILFQQISVKFETEMLFEAMEFHDSDWNKLKSANSLFTLKVTDALWSSIQQCFDDGAFLIHLVDQILKLMMLLLSRYLKWFDAFLKKWKDGFGNFNAEQLEKFIIYALIDHNTLKTLIGFQNGNVTDYNNTIFKVIPNNVRPDLDRILEINSNLLNKSYFKLQQQLICFKVQQSAGHLQQVTSIPRLYRRTNRNIPKKPSNYVYQTISPIIKLHNNFKNIMGDDLLIILDLIIRELGEQYLSLVQEVLHSVCKTEESLRRLKSRNVNITDDSTGLGGDATSDEAKIREQIKMDVGHFVTELRSFSVGSSKTIINDLMHESFYVDPK